MSGGDSASYGFAGQPVFAGAPYANQVVPTSACQAVPPPGHISGYSPPGMGGLPGYAAAGGSRKLLHRLKRYASRGVKKLKSGYKKLSKSVLKKIKWFRGTRKQRGGRYIVSPADVLGSAQGPNVFAPVSRVGCEGGTVYTQQFPQAAGGVASYAAPVSAPTMMGSPPAGLSAGADTVAYQAPNAGYGNSASTWVSSTGTQALTQQPYAAGAMNPACVTTGGGRRRQKRKGKGSRKKGKAGRKKCY